MRRHQASTFYRYGINSDANDARHMRAPFIIVSEGVRERERSVRVAHCHCQLSANYRLAVSFSICLPFIEMSISGRWPLLLVPEACKFVMNKPKLLVPLAADVGCTCLLVSFIRSFSLLNPLCDGCCCCCYYYCWLPFLPFLYHLLVCVKSFPIIISSSVCHIRRRQPVSCC